MDKTKLIGKDFNGKGIVVDYDSTSIIVRDSFGRIRTIKDEEVKTLVVDELSFYLGEVDMINNDILVTCRANDKFYEMLDAMLEEAGYDSNKVFMVLKFPNVKTHTEKEEFDGPTPDDPTYYKDITVLDVEDIRELDKELMLVNSNNDQIAPEFNLVLGDNAISNKDYADLTEVIYDQLLNPEKEDLD